MSNKVFVKIRGKQEVCKCYTTVTEDCISKKKSQLKSYCCAFINKQRAMVAYLAIVVAYLAIVTKGNNNNNNMYLKSSIQTNSMDYI